MSKIHLAFKEDNKGWVSFYTHYPEFMASLGNKFFTVKEGQLWEHNDINNPIKGHFYNDFHEMKLSFFMNNPSNEDVVFKTAKLEGNDSWDLVIETNFTLSTINKNEFNRKESYYYTYFRQNENDADLNGLKANGIGNISSYSNNRFFFDNIPQEVNVGDKLFQSDGGNTDLIGEILEISNQYIRTNNVTITVNNNAFFFSTKDSRVNGSEVRGYFAEITITNNNQYSVELFAVSTNVIKSYV